MGRRRLIVGGVPAALLAACALVQAPAPATLAGTRWQLVSITSMDDALGTLRLDDPGRFTLTLDAHGRASLKLDCNRGSASWEFRPAAADSGSFRFGEIATTRALCPPSHLDERVARDLRDVRSYRLVNGSLFLSLRADGGIYEWAPSAH